MFTSSSVMSVGSRRRRYGSLLAGAARAFTLLELLVVIAIIALLIGILVPVLSAARSRGERTACTSNIRQVGLAMRSYLDANNDIFPFASFMPSVGPSPVPSEETIYIADILLPHASGDPKVFKCPMDQGQIERDAVNQRRPYFDTEKSSYDYNSFLLGGRTMKAAVELLKDHPFLGNRNENSISIFKDYDNFHAQGGTEGARRYVYYDGHVSDYE